MHLPDKYSTFKMDLSTCCNMNAGASNVDPSSFAPLSQTVSGSSQTFVIDKQSPNQIFLKTPSAVSSVTLNTGTQYIHNVYPDKNYVLVEGTGPKLNTTPVRRPDGRIIGTFQIPKSLSNNENASCSTNDLIYNNISPNMSYRQYESSPPALSNAQKQAVRSHSWNQPSYCQNNNQEGQAIVKPNSGESHVLPSSKDQDKLTPNLEVNNSKLSMIITSTNEEEISIIPDNEVTEIMPLPSSKAAETITLTSRQQIEKRPMPKSKKQSLLRTVLMNESIESMKRHIIQSDTETESEINISDEPGVTFSQTYSTEQKQNVEEPILQSIIDTATERLFELKRKQNLPQSSYKSPTTSDDSTSFIMKNQSLNLPSKPTDTQSSPIPKIKIKTLQELQGNHISDISENSTVTTLIREGGTQELNICRAGTSNTDRIESDVKINVAPLKDGIVEACHTLLSTQRKFKELALVISYNLLYTKDKAQDLLSRFQDILKSCQNQFSIIDKTVKKEFCHLISNANIDSVLDSIKSSSDERIKKKDLATKRKRKISKTRGKKRFCTTVSNPTGWPLHDNETIEYDGKMSNADMMEGDVPLSNETLTLSNQQIEKLDMIKAKKKTKRCIWNDRRKKCASFRKRKYGRVMKDLGNSFNYSNDMAELYNLTTPRHQNAATDQGLQKKKRKPVPPKRLSGRKHPSSEEFIAHLMVSDSDPTVHYHTNYQVKPCSVLLHKLDPRIVELLQIRSAKVL